MALLGHGQTSKYPGHGTPEAAMAAEGGQIEALNQQRVSVHYSSLMQVLAALNIAWTDPDLSLLDVIQAACVDRELVVWYHADVGYCLLPVAEARRREVERGDSRGRYLCEACFDVLTDAVLPAEASPTGMEMAICPACQQRRGQSLPRARPGGLPRTRSGGLPL